MVLIGEVSVEFGDVRVIGKRVMDAQLLGKLLYHIILFDSRLEDLL